MLALVLRKGQNNELNHTLFSLTTEKFPTGKQSRTNWSTSAGKVRQSCTGKGGPYCTYCRMPRLSFVKRLKFYVPDKECAKVSLEGNKQSWRLSAKNKQLPKVSVFNELFYLMLLRKWKNHTNDCIPKFCQTQHFQEKTKAEQGIQDGLPPSTHPYEETPTQLFFTLH